MWFNILYLKCKRCDILGREAFNLETQCSKHCQKTRNQRMSGKLKTSKEVREKSGNFAKFSRKLKFLTLKKFNMYNTAILEYCQLN